MFSDINVSQGSVATFVRCGGVFNTDFIANLLASQWVKECEDLLASGEVTDKSVVIHFFGPPCILRPVLSNLL